MRLSDHSRRKAGRGQRVIAVALVALMIGQFSPIAAGEVSKRVRETVGASFEYVAAKVRPAAAEPLQQQDTAQQRAALVSTIQLCPQQLKLYEGETFAFVPAGLDNTDKIVQSVSLDWQSSAPAVASVQPTGEVTAVSAGTATVTVTIGSSTASATVQVVSGVRPKQTDAEWDEEHAADCGSPVGAAPPSRDQSPPRAADDRGSLLKAAVRPVVFDAGRKERKATLRDARPAVTFAATKKPAGRLALQQLNLPDPLDGGDGGDSFSQTATAWYNVVGNPRYMPQEEMGGGGIKTKQKLGSLGYSFTAPVLALGGRGIGVNLALTYNSRLWNKEINNAMQFNYNRGWPAAGWSLGYGRIIENYDNTATGDKSGFGSANRPGNYLLLQPDGTRIHLDERYDSTIQRWYHISLDGSYLELSPNKNLFYPDGTKVSYVYTYNNRLLPNYIRTRNGDQLNISYRQRTSSFKSRWSIDQIQDTLGRLIKFYYYGDSGYAVGTGKPQSALAAITAPDQITGQERVMVRLEYQDITLGYNFSTPPPADSVPTTLTVVRKIYYPATGRGYLFDQFSSYGMARKISMRKDMNNGTTGGGDGTEIAYTYYDYPANTTESGQINDAPKYTHRHEWWSGKTDEQGNAVSAATIYTYQRDPGAMADTVYIPDSTNTGYIAKMITTGDASGFFSSSEMRDSQNQLLQKTETFYSTFDNNGIPLPRQVLITNEANQVTKTIYDYYSNAYGRLRYIDEYGFAGSIQRRTEFEYINDQGYIDNHLFKLVKWQRVYSGSNLNQAVAATRLFYDDYTIKGGMEYYSGQTIPATHHPPYDQTFTVRGNATTIRSYSSINPDVFNDHSMKYDIFGNVLEADASCCSVKKSGYSYNTTWYSQPDWTRDGNEQATHLDTSYIYDFYTGLTKQVTAPNGQSVNSTYDSAWRPDTVTNPGTGATQVTRFDKDSFQNDQLSYFERASYNDNGTKTITTRSWHDGAERPVRKGIGAGSSPSSYDMSAVTYDHLGRATRQSVPYTGDSSGNGTPPYYTVSRYDALSRVYEVDLPDDNPSGQRSRVQTTFSGATITITDQVGRQQRSQEDGLGRLITVTEPDPASGALTLTTSYTYNVLDKLTQVNQGGQMRAFKYDALGRLLFEKTPEQTATIADGSTPNQWTAAYTYTDFDAVATRKDARGVVTTYTYGALNRLQTVTYDTSGAQDVETTSQVTFTYYTSGSGNGRLQTIDNGTVLEELFYDSIGRLGSLRRTFPGNSNHYTTSYEYNAAGQLAYLTYPSGKRLRMTYDARGRTAGLDKMSGTVVQTAYLSQVSYNTAGQVTGATLGSGVVDTFAYDAQRFQLTSQTATRNGSTLLSLQYSHQANAGQSGVNTSAGNSGQLMSISGTVNGQGRGQTFNYDSLNRLVTATGIGTGGGWQRRYAYDRWGNRTGVWNATAGGTQIQSLSLQQSGGVPTNRLTSVTNGSATVNYSYDNNGNVTGDGAHGYRYDAENRLVSVDNGSSGTYGYDTANWRVKKLVPVGATSYTTYAIWEGGLVIAEYSDAPAQGSGGLKYYEADQLSTRLTTSGTGVVAGTQDHMPFGEEAGVTGEAEKHRFTNYERDAESGTDYAVNRQYSQNTGRFYRPDPVKGDLSIPQSLNRYAYSLNDPINAADPLGLKACQLSTQRPGCLWCTSDSADSNGGFQTWYECAPVDITPITPRPRVEPPTIDPGTVTDIPNRLTPCLKTLLSGLFRDFSIPPVIPFQDLFFHPSLNLDRIRFHEGLPWFSKLATITPGAMTRGYNIYFAGKGDFTVSTIIHELVHTEQYTNFVALNITNGGTLALASFEQAYLAASGVALALGDSTGYWKNVFEKQARAKNRAIFAEVKKRWEQNNCGIPLGAPDEEQ